MAGPVQSFKLPRFESGKPLLDQLSATRMNAILDAIEGGRAVLGVNTTGRWTPAGTVINASPTGKGGGTSLILPFKVTVHSGATGPDGVNVYPGLVTTFVPTINGVLLTATVGTPPMPPLLGVAGTCSVFLEVTVNMADAVNFRNGVVAADIITDQGVIPNAEYDPVTGEVLELNTKWVGGDLGPRVVGTFYLKIASVNAVSVAGTVVSFTITQWLFASIRTFICVGKKVIVLV